MLIKRPSLQRKLTLKKPTKKHSNESWNWFIKSNIPGALSPVLENFYRRFSLPD